MSLCLLGCAVCQVYYTVLDVTTVTKTQALLTVMASHIIPVTDKLNSLRTDLPLCGVSFSMGVDVSNRDNLIDETSSCHKVFSLF